MTGLMDADAGCNAWLFATVHLLVTRPNPLPGLRLGQLCNELSTENVENIKPRLDGSEAEEEKVMP